ncbi:DUF2165 family protein [Rhodovibrionaceae bacterium A322]
MSLRRLSHVLLVVMVAGFFVLVTLNNLVDYQSNWAFVQHVLAMDSLFPNSQLPDQRAITSPALQALAYWLIILFEGLTALVLLWAAWRLWQTRGAELQAYRKAKDLAVFGLALGAFLYGFGFLVVGGEWFAMWQSKIWNGQASAARFLIMIFGTLIFLALPEPDDS